jgi:hypothetical protein
MLGTEPAPEVGGEEVYGRLIGSEGIPYLPARRWKSGHGENLARLSGQRCREPGANPA